MLRVGVKRSSNSSNSVVGECLSPVKPPRKRVKVASEEDGERWVWRAWTSLVRGFNRLFKRRNIMALPTDSTSSTSLEHHSQPKLQSQSGNDDVMGVPVLTSTPFQPMTSVCTPLGSPKPSAIPLVLPTSGPSTGRPSLSAVASVRETFKPIENQPVALLEKQSPTVHTSRQGSEPITVSAANTVNSRSADHILKPVSTSSGLDQPSITGTSHGSNNIFLSPHHSKNLHSNQQSLLFSAVLSPEVIGPSVLTIPTHSLTTRLSRSVPIDGGSTSVREMSSSFSTPPSSTSCTSTHSRQALTIHPHTSSLTVDHHNHQDCSGLLDRTKCVIGHNRISQGPSVDSGRNQVSRTALRSQGSLQMDKKRKMFSFLEKVKSDHQRSVEDKRSIAEAIGRKLRIHQHERMALEDARVARLRDQLSRATVDEVKTGLVEMLAPLSDIQLSQVTMATRGGPSTECLSQKFNIRITRGDIVTLVGLQWLNDEVINFYFNLIKERSCTVETTKLRKVHVFNSFFYPKLSQAGYSGVRRWTRKVDIFDYDMILLPVHLGMHWCLAAVDYKEKCISYYDSLGGENPSCLKRLRDYLVDESRDKKGVEFDVSGWSVSTPRDIPQQRNGSDCGVFTCMYARYLSVGSPFKFSQDNMPEMREHMIAEILEQKLF